VQDLPRLEIVLLLLRAEQNAVAVRRRLLGGRIRPRVVAPQSCRRRLAPLRPEDETENSKGRLRKASRQTADFYSRNKEREGQRISYRRLILTLALVCDPVFSGRLNRLRPRRSVRPASRAGGRRPLFTVALAEAVEHQIVNEGEQLRRVRGKRTNLTKIRKAVEKAI
jgi:hypothetical protein